MFAMIAIAVLTVVDLVLIGVLLVLGVPVPDQLYMTLTGGLGAMGGAAALAPRPLESRARARDGDGPDDDEPDDQLPRHLVRKDTGERLHGKDAA